MTYTDVSLNEASEVIKLAGFKDLLSIEELDGGWANSNYILSLENNEKLVLKIWNEQSIEKVNYLIKMTNYIIEKKFPTPKPIKFIDGNYILNKNGRAWTLLPFIQGKWLESNHLSLYSLGIIQAKLHSIEPPKALKNEFSMGYKLFNKLYNIADENNEWTDFIKFLKNETEELLIKIGHLPKGIIHGDLFSDNVLAINNEVVAVLDFEEICYDFLAFDLVMTFVGFGWEKGEPIKERWDSILEGYQTIRVLSDEEIRALPHLHKLATLSIAAWRYWQFVINLPNTAHSDRYLEMKNRLGKELPF
ncbi:MAG: phosphotransferase [Euryarchaeota archaeon]|nr:phosphotransferase [Euryarchaeota archaeon]